jgi:hypothetical protein
METLIVFGVVAVVVFSIVILVANKLLGKSNPSEPSPPKPSPPKEKSYTGWILTVIIIIGATLPFHYVPSHLAVFPKDNLTFSNTFITETDIDELLKRYNDASSFEKQSINQEPLMVKLRAKGIVKEEGKSKD